MPTTCSRVESGFNLAVQGADPNYNVVVIDCAVDPHEFTGLAAFAQAGGRALLQYWNLTAGSSLAAAFQVAVANQVADFLRNGTIRNAVNFPAVDGETMATLRPYLTLAEKLGSMVTQITRGGLQEIAVEFIGDVVKYDTTPLTIALLKGVFTPILGDEVNFEEPGAKLDDDGRWIRRGQHRMGRSRDRLNAAPNPQDSGSRCIRASAL